jgi:hypothetical protein
MTPPTYGLTTDERRTHLQALTTDMPAVRRGAAKATEDTS